MAEYLQLCQQGTPGLSANSLREGIRRSNCYRPVMGQC